MDGFTTAVTTATERVSARLNEEDNDLTLIKNDFKVILFSMNNRKTLLSSYFK